MKERIIEKISKNLQPEFLEVKNKSHLHQGHLGDDGSGETHFELVVKSKQLEGLNKVQAHRKINEIVREEFLNGLHALEIKISL